MKCFDIEISEQKLQTWEENPVKHKREIERLDRKLYKTFNSTKELFLQCLKDLSVPENKEIFDADGVLTKLMGRVSKMKCAILEEELERTGYPKQKPKPPVPEVGDPMIQEVMRLSRMFNIKAEA